MFFQSRLGPHKLLLAILPLLACPGSTEPWHFDGSRPEGSTPAADRSAPREGIAKVDLTAVAGDPCTYGKCGPNLICMANICHAICSTECNDAAPECDPDTGCQWVTSFSAACLPGTAEYLQTCGNGVRCKAKLLCVRVGSSKTAKCLKLCKYGCPTGSQCGQTSNGCDVCLQ